MYTGAFMTTDVVPSSTAATMIRRIEREVRVGPRRGARLDIETGRNLRRVLIANDTQTQTDRHTAVIYARRRAGNKTAPRRN